MLIFNNEIKNRISLNQTSKPRTSQQLTTANIQFLKSLGLKIKNSN